MVNGVAEDKRAPHPELFLGILRQAVLNRAPLGTMASPQGQNANLMPPLSFYRFNSQVLGPKTRSDQQPTPIPIPAGLPR